jgi:phosphatidylglycerophosphatase A
MKTVTLLIAQGLGVGRIPFAPGTFGSVVGVGWFCALLATGNPWLYVLGTIAGLGTSVWFCGAAEQILGQTDPGSVVLDEIAVLPVCFAGFVIAAYQRTGSLPAVASLFEKNGPLIVLAVFVLFRFFDIAKPWPIRQSQALPGGWGVTVDDLLAAICTAATAYALLRAFGRHQLG